VRETYASLRTDGIIQTRQGQGATVTSGMNAMPFRIPTDSLVSEQSIVEVFELRLAVESEAAGLAAQRATTAQRKAIGKALRMLEAAGERGEDGVEEDFGFHRAIVDGSNNSRYREFVDFLGWKIRDQATITRHKSELAHRMDLLRIEHSAIHDAIMRGDADAARTAARTHFQNGIQRFQTPNK
jgi:DNA-binding FadR family transcriptional regulator